MSGSRLLVDGVTVRYGDQVALDRVTLEVAAGEVVAVVGPSGSGKSTLLRVVAGLEPLSAGRVVVGTRDLTGVATHERGVGLMFQDHALFTHLDVAGNVAYGLRIAGVVDAERRSRVDQLLDLVGLRGFGHRRVDQLSGGEAQRVALARALAPAPRLLMLDEPLGSLDRALREQLVGELRRLLTELGQTALHVTHDQAEAFALADRVAILDGGRLVATGSPAELWADPGSLFVARFLGHPNIWRVVVAGDGTVAAGGVALGSLPPGHGLRQAAVGRGPVDVVVPVSSVRPIIAGEDRGGDGEAIAAVVERVVVERGSHRVTARLVGPGSGAEGGPTTTYDSPVPVRIGDRTRVGVALDGIRLLRPATHRPEDPDR